MINFIISLFAVIGAFSTGFYILNVCKWLFGREDEEVEDCGYNNVPKMKNPPPPPKFQNDLKENMRRSLEFDRNKSHSEHSLQFHEKKYPVNSQKSSE